MHIASLDRRNSGNEPALDLLRAKSFGQIARDRAKGDALQICTRRREMLLVRLRPARAQTVDDLKQKRSSGDSPDKSSIGAAIKISNPNREHIVIEDGD